MTSWQQWRYRNLTFLLISFAIAFFLFKQQAVHSFLLNLGDIGYFGAFIGGILFVSTFTVATGALILMILAEKLSPIEIGIIAGLGAVVGDFMIFRFVKDSLTNELEEIYNKIDSRHHLVKILHTKYFSWTLPVMGAIIIASPFPDEIGVSLMGISKMKTYQFLLIAFVLDAVGIFLVISAKLAINP
jgi:hypothetical protein